jgi:hypothetical protein
MTKNFCDQCKVEMGEDETAKVSLFGRINGEHKSNRYLFCENCFSEINIQFREIILKKLISKSATIY